MPALQTERKDSDAATKSSTESNFTTGSTGPGPSHAAGGGPTASREPTTQSGPSARPEAPSSGPASKTADSPSGVVTANGGQASSPAQTSPAQKQTLRKRLAGMFRRNRGEGAQAGSARTQSPQAAQSGEAAGVTQPELKEVEDNRRDASIQQLRRGFNETMDTMKAVRTHMEDHSRRSQRMVELLEGLNGLPEASRQQTTVLRDVQKGIESSNRNSGELSKSVQNLSQSTAKQDEALTKLDKRLGTQDEVRQSLDSLSSSLTKIDKTHSEAQEAYTRDMKQTREALAQGRKTMIIVGVIASVLAAAALGVSLYAVFALTAV